MARRSGIRNVSALLLCALLAACAAPTPQVVTVQETVVVTTEKVVEVEKVVQQTVEVPLAPAAAPKGGRLVMGTDKFPSGLDPHVNSSWDVMRILVSVYDPLLWQDPETGEILPGLAESWEISNDGLHYTLRLRKDVSFHDGTPFNAEAAKFSLDRILAPETQSQYAKAFLGPTDSIDAVDEYTLRINLKTPSAYLLSGLSQTYVAMVSPAAVEKWGSEYQLHQVGTGPFIMKEYVPKDHVTLTRNEKYSWAPSIFEHQGPAYLEEIEWHFLPEEATRLPALETGDVQLVISLPPIDATRLTTLADFSLLTSRLRVTQPLEFFINTQKPPTDDIRVRQALNYATDQQSILNSVLRGLYLPAHGPLAGTTFEYSDQVEGMYPYDVEKAKALLDDAGWKAGSDGMRFKDGQPLKLLMSSQTWNFIPPIAQTLQGQLRQVGIDVEVEQMTFPAQMTAGAEGTKNVLVNGGNGFTAADALDGYFGSWSADGGFAWSKMKDPDLDKLLVEGAQTLDPEKRKAIYAEAQVRIMEQALIIPIYDYTILVGVNNKVMGLSWDISNVAPLAYDAYIAAD